MKVCFQCGQAIKEQMKFCSNCGAPQNQSQESPVEKIIFNRTDDIDIQFTEQFFLALKIRIQEEHEAEAYQAYSERVYESGFRDTLSRKAMGIEEQIQVALKVGQLDLRTINQAAVLLLEDLLDFFIIRFCPDLNKNALPETILKHPYSGQKTQDLKTITFDYLDLNNEKERIYFDLLKMPVEKLQNAGKSFLFPAKEEKIWFICDTTVFGNAKEGFAMTDHAIYWKMPYEKARKAPYQMINALTRKKSWLTINDFYFNINPGFNLKMFKLLKKLNTLPSL